MDQERNQKVWEARIAREKEAHRNCRKRIRDARKMLEVDEDCQYVPLYWSVVNVEMNGCYSAQPKPFVTCANKDSGPEYKQVAHLIGRALGRVVDDDTFDTNTSRAVRSYLGLSLGIVRVKVESVINQNVTKVPIFGRDPMGQPMQVGYREEVEETVGDQTLRWEYFPAERFGWEPCNNWDHCGWCYFKHPMTRAEIYKRFGVMVKTTKDDESKRDDPHDKTSDVYEIWDKDNRKVLFLIKGEDEPLEVVDDPLGLQHFWPFPRPLMTNVLAEELIPIPDYEFIQEYDRELNRLQERRRDILEQIKAAGAYDSGLKELGQMLENEDGEYVAVQGLAARLAAAGGEAGVVYHLPMQEKVETLMQLTQQIQFVKAQVDEILGISDIVRGVTKASESATAQEIKGRWVGVRLTDKRERVIYAIREMMRISAEILAQMFTPENLQRMTQMQITDKMLQIMRNDTLFEFSIDIETDSTVAKDEFRERETRQEMLNALAQYSQSVLPMVMQNAMPADTASTILKAALAPYARVDRTLEETLNSLPTTQQQMQRMGQQMQQLQQQMQQFQQQAQYWQQVATQLQQQATQAKAARDMADAGKKQAETREIITGLPADAAEGENVAADTFLKRAKAVEAMNKPVNGA